MQVMKFCLGHPLRTYKTRRVFLSSCETQVKSLMIFLLQSWKFLTFFVEEKMCYFERNIIVGQFKIFSCKFTHAKY